MLVCCGKSYIVQNKFKIAPNGAEYINDGWSPSKKDRNLVKSPERAQSILNMMRYTFGISYCALSGLEDFLSTFLTGLHPVLTDCALSGLSEILLSRVGSDRMDSVFFFRK
jgi:hypothetical protein